MGPNNKRRKISIDSYEGVATNTPNVPAPKVAPNEVAKPDQRRSLFVRSLPASVTTERLTEHFSESFPLKHATVVVDPQTKISKGFGFVTFADTEDAQAAILQFNDSVLDGRKIKVELAQSRHRDAEDGVGVRGSKKSSVNTTAVQLRAQREKDKQETQPPRLIVRNLPWSIKNGDDLAFLFRSYGKVKHAVVPKKSPKVQYGFGIVMLRGKKNAEKAIAGVNGKEVDGRTLAVDWAVDKATWEEQQQQQTTAEEEVATDEEPSTNVREADGGEDDEVTSADDMELEVEAEASEDDLDEELDMNIEPEAEPDQDKVTDDGDDEEDEDEDEEENNSRNDTTIFIRNLPFTTDDDILKEHFSKFGPVRYARVVYDPETERSKGTAFVCFFNLEDAKSCVKDAPKHEAFSTTDSDSKGKKRKAEPLKHSILQNEATDPSGKYTLEGRVLNVTRALSREGAERRATEASNKRDIRDRDKRRLYLLSEGSVSRGSKLADQLGKAELDIRESSARQRQRLLKSNPNLCLSLTRLSVRNIPRSIGSKELKALAREAVVGFAKDAKSGVREPLSRDELSRGGAEMREAEKKRKQQGKGIVRQAKVVFEDKEGSKVKDGAGRSRGYGFIEYVSHRNALAGLRWLNGHSVKAGGGDRGKRLIVEFAIENAQVVQRRNEREKKANEIADKKAKEGKDKEKPTRTDSELNTKGKKRKRSDKDDNNREADKSATMNVKAEVEDKNKIAKRNRIIAKKRHARKARKG